mgnify:CR=1 FL=1
MKFFRLSILLMCCFLMNAFQAKAQCSISNLTVTSINCVPNGANQDITYCGTFMASNTNGSYDVTAFHQAFLDVTTSINNLATDGLVSFCATVPNVSFDPEGIVINEVFNNACNTLLDRHSRGVDYNFWIFWNFVFRINTSEVFNLTLAGFLI